MIEPVGTKMTNDDYASKLSELERLLNDPLVSIDPARIWYLLGEVSKHENNVGVRAHQAPGPPRVTPQNLPNYDITSTASDHYPGSKYKFSWIKI